MTHSTPIGRHFGCPVRRIVHVSFALWILLVASAVWPPAAVAQVRATARPGATPAWNKGLQPISAESYYNAIECGTQGGGDPPCVFWDTGLCKNDDFTLAAYSAYKQVAYQVWTAVQRQQPVPQPDYQVAGRTRVTITLTPTPGSDNLLTDLILTRDGIPVDPVERSVRNGRFTFDYPAWAPTATVTLNMVGEARTISCVIEPSVLRQLR